MSTETIGLIGDGEKGGMGVLLIECTFYAIGLESVVCFFSDMVHDAERQILKNVEQKTASWSPAVSLK